MAQFGFEVSASMQAVSSKDDYAVFVDNVGYQQTYPEIILVTSNHGPTDLLNNRGGQKLSTPIPGTRIGSIRSIPWLVFRHLQGNSGLATPKYLSEVWEFTFQYIFDLLEPIRTGDIGTELLVRLEFTLSALESFGGKITEDHIDRESKFWKRLGWLNFVTFHPLKRFATPKGKTSIWNEEDILSQFQDTGSEYVPLPNREILDDWYITRAVVLATTYALCCKWLDTNNELQSPLDIEIAFCPDFLRHGNLAPWISLGPSYEALMGIKTPRYLAEIKHVKWFQLIVKVFSGVARYPALESRAKGEIGNSFRSILGFQKNGIALLPNLLLYPSGNSPHWFRYHIHVGQLMDFPLDDDGFVCAANKPSRTSICKTWKPELERQHTHIDNPPVEMIVRIDPEPWWEFDERTIVFRARVGGVVKAVFSPEVLFHINRYHSVSKPNCDCLISKDSADLAQVVIVLRMSEFLLHQGEVIDNTTGERRGGLPVVVQTGGDKMAKILCLAISNITHSESVEKCIHSLENRSQLDDLVLL